MFGALAKSPSSVTSSSPIPVGRSFVLGMPDKQGMFRIFLNGTVWRIAPGNYRSGERVSIVESQEDLLIVKPA